MVSFSWFILWQNNPNVCESSISMKTLMLVRPLILNYDLIAFTLTYLSAEQV